MPLYKSFMERMKGKILGVDDQLRLKPEKTIFNQKVLKSIIETIVFCGRQGLSLRGHRDDPQYFGSSLLNFTDVNIRNFPELLRFRVSGGMIF